MRWLFLLGLLLPSPAPAQPADCPAELAAPAMRLAPRIVLEGRPGVPRGVRGQVPIDLGEVPAGGTVCGAGAPLPEEVLHGPRLPLACCKAMGRATCCTIAGRARWRSALASDFAG